MNFTNSPTHQFESQIPLVRDAVFIFFIIIPIFKTTFLYVSGCANTFQNLLTGSH